MAGTMRPLYAEDLRAGFPVWLEDRGEGVTFGTLVEGREKWRLRFKTLAGVQYVSRPKAGYGRTWRAWVKMPPWRLRQGTEWEDINDADR